MTASSMFELSINQSIIHKALQERCFLSPSQAAPILRRYPGRSRAQEAAAK